VPGHAPGVIPRSLDDARNHVPGSPLNSLRPKTWAGPHTTTAPHRMKNARIRGFFTLGALLVSVSLVFWRFDAPESASTRSSPPTGTGALAEATGPKGNPFDLRPTPTGAVGVNTPPPLPQTGSPFSTAFVGDAAGSFEGRSHDRAQFDTANDSHAAMVQVLQRIRDEHRYETLTFGGESVTDHESRLGRVTASPQRLLRSLTSLAERRLWLGDTRAAVAHLQTATDLLATSGMSVLPATRAGLSARLGLAWLRLAENENCVDCNNSASCLLPLSPGGVHRLQEGSRAAMRSLTETLAASPHDLTSRWLLNIAAMTVGEYPAGVPEAFRLIPESLESEEAFPRFLNVALERGVNTVSHSGGSVIDDFDGDGDLDLVVSSWGEGDELQYFRNTGASFVEASQKANFSGLYGGLNMIQADYDNDGDIDLFVLRGAWLRSGGSIPNSLLSNDGHGRFTDVTFTVGLAEPACPTQTAVWLDYDNDGDLDLFVGNEELPCQLFRNIENVRFEDVAAAAGVALTAFVKGVTAADYDNDGFTDIYVSVLGGANRLFHNNGNGTFTDVAKKLGVDQPIDSFPTWFWDANQDGHLDLFVAGYSLTLDGLASTFFGERTSVPLAHLYEGDGKGSFREVGQTRNLRNTLPPMGANFGDLDNDGYPDIYLGTGTPAYEGLMPNVMYHNDRGQRFLNVTTAGGFGHLQKGHGISFADIDNDGDQDVFAEMGGAYPGDMAANALFENPGFGNHWLTVQLVGHRSNRSAIGARIIAHIRDGDDERKVYDWVGGGGSFGASPLRCEIGLGKATAVEKLEIHWPASGTTQVFAHVPADRFLRIDEGRDTLSELTLSGPQ